MSLSRTEVSEKYATSAFKVEKLSSALKGTVDSSGTLALTVYAMSQREDRIHDIHCLENICLTRLLYITERVSVLVRL